MEYYMDEKWKISKEDKKSYYSNSSGKSSLPRSYSTKAASSHNHNKNPFSLSRSCSQKSTSSSSTLPRSSSQRCSEFTRKCKEQKAKFYIVKRCIGMLVSWKKNSDS